MQDSFGCGKDLFPSFFDVQRISEELGYHGLGLAALAGRLLGCPFHKARSVTMSNWEARTLAPAQLRYAALDAFVTGQLFRLVRRWRRDLGIACCATCLIPFGQVCPWCWHWFLSFTHSYFCLIQDWIPMSMHGGWDECVWQIIFMNDT